MPTFSTPSTQNSLCRMLEGKKKHATAVAHTQKKNSLNQGVKVVLYVRSKNTYFIFRFQNLVYETLPKRNSAAHK